MWKASPVLKERRNLRQGPVSNGTGEVEQPAGQDYSAKLRTCEKQSLFQKGSHQHLKAAANVIQRGGQLQKVAELGSFDHGVLALPRRIQEQMGCGIFF